MPLKLKTLGGDRTWTAGVWIIGGLGAIGYGGITGHTMVLGLGAAMLPIGLGLWFRAQWARIAGVVVMLTSSAVGLWMLSRFGVTFVGVVAPIASAAFAWQIWREFDPKRIEAESADRKPMISFALLLREPRFLDAQILAQSVSAAWGGEYVASDIESESPQHSDTEEPRWVIGRSPLFMVYSPDGFFIVHNHDRPYFDEPEAAAQRMVELRARHAIEQNRAWMAVDVMGAEDDPRQAKSYYGAVGRLIAELAGPDTLAIYHPDSGRLNPWDDALLEKLRGPNPLEDFAEPVNVPVIEVDEEDPRMVAAVAEARRRWPEFVEAFRAKAGENFGVKAPLTVDDDREFIWIEVVGLEPDYVHGTLGNEPVALGWLKMGDRVEVPVKDVTDWAYLRDGQPVGMFSVKVLDAVAKEQAKKR